LNENKDVKEKETPAASKPTAEEKSEDNKS